MKEHSLSAGIVYQNGTDTFWNGQYNLNDNTVNLPITVSIMAVCKQMKLSSPHGHDLVLLAAAVMLVS